MTPQEILTRAKTAFRMGDYQEAEKLLGKILKQTPGFLAGQNFLGSVYDRLGRYEQAIEQFRQVIAVEKDYTEAHNNLGVTLKNAGRFEEAGYCHCLHIAFSRRGSADS